MVLLCEMISDDDVCVQFKGKYFYYWNLCIYRAVSIATHRFIEIIFPIFRTVVQFVVFVPCFFVVVDVEISKRCAYLHSTRHHSQLNAHLCCGTFQSINCTSIMNSKPIMMNPLTEPKFHLCEPRTIELDPHTLHMCASTLYFQFG